MKWLEGQQLGLSRDDWHIHHYYPWTKWENCEWKSIFRNNIMVHDDVGKMNDVWLRRFTFMTSSCLFSMPLREAEDNETMSPPSTVVCDLRAAGNRVVLGICCTVRTLQGNGGLSSTEITKSVRLLSLLLLLLKYTLFMLLRHLVTEPKTASLTKKNLAVLGQWILPKIKIYGENLRPLIPHSFLLFPTGPKL